MRILCHRGYWRNKIDQNKISTLMDGLTFGDGVEFDVRDFQDDIVISHDIVKKKPLKLEKFFKEYKKNNFLDKYLAINIKADGLKNKLGELIRKYEIKNYFFFDMSIPELVQYKNDNYNFLTRLSNIEKKPVLFEKSLGLWVDSFGDFKFNKKLINKAISESKIVVFVSPELHKINCNLWDNIKYYSKYNKSFLCTDRIIDAKSYFKI